MKIFMSSDIEGTTGIAAWDETEKESPFYSYFQKQMTREVAAACTGAEEAGAKKILVRDAHDSARNIDPSELPENVCIVRGWKGDMLSMMSGVDTDNFDAAIMTGYHSWASCDGSPLSHTMNGKNDYVTINGQRMSEFMLNAYIAGYFGVPVCFVSGDKSLCDFAKEMIPGITTVAVQEGAGASTTSIHPDVAVRKIKEGVRHALEGDYSSCMAALPPYFEVEIRFKEHTLAHSRSYYPGASLKDEKTVSFETDNFLEVIRFFHFVL